MHEVVARALRERYPVLYGEATPTCGSGWFPILDYLGYLATHGPQLPNHPLRAAQVKEKFGALRFYLQWPVAQIHRDVAWLCGEWSTHTCEICGAAGERRVSLGGSVETRCYDHVDYPAREDYPLSQRIQAMLSSEATLDGGWRGGYVRMNPSSRARLSPFTPVETERQDEIRETFLNELAILVQREAVSPQLLALMCVAGAALDIACERPEERIPLLRSRGSELANTGRVAAQMESLLRTWRRA